MTRRPRRLRPEEEELWQRVAQTLQPMRAATPMAPPRPPEATRDAPAPPKTPAFRPKAFHVGEHAPRPKHSHDLAPSPAERLAHAPVQMDRKAFERMTRGKLLPEARIDLHGMTLSQAHPALIRFVLGAHADGLRLVLVITGKGRAGEDVGPIPQRPGILKHQAPHWLSMPPLGALVLQVTEAHLRHGGSGAYYVYLRRTR